VLHRTLLNLFQKVVIVGKIFGKKFLLNNNSRKQNRIWNFVSSSACSKISAILQLGLTFATSVSCDRSVISSW